MISTHTHLFRVKANSIEGKTWVWGLSGLKTLLVVVTDFGSRKPESTASCPSHVPGWNGCHRCHLLDSTVFMWYTEKSKYSAGKQMPVWRLRIWDNGYHCQGSSIESLVVATGRWKSNTICQPQSYTFFFLQLYPDRIISSCTRRRESQEQGI